MVLSRRKGFAILRKLYPLITTTFICCMGYFAIYVHAEHQGEVFSTETNYIAISKLDSVMSSIHAIATTAIPLARIDCQTTHDLLQQIVRNNPPIKSIDLIKNKQFYCSSDQDFTAKRFFNNSLTTQEMPAISYVLFNRIYNMPHQSTRNPNVDIVVTLKDSKIIDILTPRIPTQIISFKLHDITITHQGLREPKKYLNTVTDQSFSKAPYVVETAYTDPPSLGVLIHYYGIHFMVVTLISFFSYFFTRWIINSLSGAYYELYTAITDNQIKTYIQPLFFAHNNQLMGLEVLVRWHHPRSGVIMPDMFIPLAEKTGLIIPLTQQLMKEVAIALAPYAKNLPINFHVGFNISRVHCQNLAFINDCKNFYQYIDNNNITLVIEVTERELIEVTETTKQLFRELHEINAKIALDDFGIGNSNLNYLYDFSIDYLKIDKSFVSRLGSNALSESILDSIIEIAQNCHLESCAEGIETEEQAHYLRNKGVTILQGFLLGKPIAINRFLQSSHFQNLVTTSF